MFLSKQPGSIWERKKRGENAKIKRRVEFSAVFPHTQCSQQQTRHAKKKNKRKRSVWNARLLSFVFLCEKRSLCSTHTILRVFSLFFSFLRVEQIHFIVTVIKCSIHSVFNAFCKDLSSNFKQNIYFLWEFHYTVNFLHSNLKEEMSSWSFELISLKNILNFVSFKFITTLILCSNKTFNKVKGDQCSFKYFMSNKLFQCRLWRLVINWIDQARKVRKDVITCLWCHWLKIAISIILKWFWRRR